MARLSRVKELRKNLLIISAIVTVLVIVAGVSYFLLSHPSPTEPPPQVRPATEQPASAKQSPPGFEQKIENLKKAITEACTTGESQEVTLVFTEAEANEQAAKLLLKTEIPEEIPLAVESINIDFKTGNSLVTEVESVTYGFKITIKVRMLVGTEAGKPKVEVTDVSFGIVPLPEPVKEKITAFISQETDNLLNQLGEVATSCQGKVDLEFTQIRTEEDKVTIRVVVEPRA